MNTVFGESTPKETKFCKDCAHYSRKYYTKSGDCKHPKSAIPNLVEGGYWHPYAANARQSAIGCGHEGRRFEQTYSFWAILKGLFGVGE